MIIQTIPKIKPIDTLDGVAYEYLLCVASDGLYVLSSNRDRIVEIIVDGSDESGYVCSAYSEDDFLDAINILKQDLISGRNPLDRIL